MISRASGKETDRRYGGLFLYLLTKSRQVGVGEDQHK